MNSQKVPDVLRFDNAHALIVPFTLQQRAWLKLYRVRDSVNQMSAVFGLRLSGALNVEALRASLQMLFARHDSLRATIFLDEANPRQCIQPVDHFPVDTLIAASGKLEASSIETTLSEFANKRQDLEVGPLFEVKLVQCSSNETLLVWGINHFVADGQSLHVLFRELWLLYRKLLRADSSPLPPLAITQISNYQAWQQETHRLWRINHQRDWLHHLADADGIRWPPEQHLSESTPGSTYRCHVCFPAPLTAAIGVLARRARSMVSLIIITVYVALIARWCNQHKFVAQITLNGRDTLDHRYLVGFLAHFTYLRIELRSNDTYIDLLRQVTQEYRRAISQRDFGSVVSDTPEVSAGTYFQWLSWGMDGVGGVPTPAEASAIDLQGELVIVPRRRPVDESFRFSTMLWNTPEGIRGTLLTRADLYSVSTLEKICLTMRETAARMVENPYSHVLTTSPYREET
jgi:hypothetical protein